MALVLTLGFGGASAACSILAGYSGGDEGGTPPNAGVEAGPPPTIVGLDGGQAPDGGDAGRGSAGVQDVVTVVTGEQGPRGIAVGRKAVFWVNELDKSVRSLGFEETAAKTIYKTAASPFDVLVEGDDVYVHQPGSCGAADPSVERIRSDGSNARILVRSNSCDSMSRFALDAVAVVVSVNGNRADIVQASKDPGVGPTILRDSPFRPGPLRSDGLKIYFGRDDTGEIAVASKGSDQGQTKTFAKGFGKALDIALDDEWVYWVSESGKVLGSPKQSPPGAEPKVTVIAPAEPSPARIAVDETDVYWTSGDAKAVRRARKPRLGGGPPETVAKGIEQPFGLAVASDAVWVTTRLGDIVRIRLMPR